MLQSYMGRSEREQSSDTDADEVLIFDGHSVVKGPKSFSETNSKSNDKDDE